MRPRTNLIAQPLRSIIKSSQCQKHISPQTSRSQSSNKLIQTRQCSSSSSALQRVLPTLRPLRPTHLASLRVNAVDNGRTHTRSFITSPVHQKKGQRIKQDRRVTMIRYHLRHPKLPRPLRFSRLRALRHWTIHRAWHLYKAQQRQAEQLSLERHYNSMRLACEALRLTGEDGLSITTPGKHIPPPGARDPKTATIKITGEDGKTEMVELDVHAAAARQKEVGRLFRIAMMKDRGVLDTVPIEYARAQTDTPPRNGWDHGWTR